MLSGVNPSLDKAGSETDNGMSMLAYLNLNKAVPVVCAGAMLLSLSTVEGQDIRQAIIGSWIINEELSDDTDDQVAEAIEAGGGRDSRGFFNRQEDFYRGGPPEQELYDRISYDDILSIDYTEPEFRFAYADNYVRVFHTDGRRRRTTANDFYIEGGQDWSSANWEGGALVVEARPRDGGFTVETYTLEADGNRLRIEMLIQPNAFREPIDLVRVFDRNNQVP
ncbi:MAG TPA: hypothetical protein DCM64_05630 [Gammaproteobacteria bacterium]|nr:hypothetical protein [Gammaproteobacteria bacterium]